MNPFVDPTKRSVTLPTGCKDLIDVLNGQKYADNEIYRQIIRTILFQAQQDRATEVVIGKISADGKTPVAYKVENVWHEIPPFPSEIRPNVISQLARMAGFPAGQTQGEGVLKFRRLRWTVQITDADAACRLVSMRD